MPRFSDLPGTRNEGTLSAGTLQQTGADFGKTPKKTELEILCDSGCLVNLLQKHNLDIFLLTFVLEIRNKFGSDPRKLLQIQSWVSWIRITSKVALSLVTAKSRLWNQSAPLSEVVFLQNENGLSVTKMAQMRYTDYTVLYLYIYIYI